MSVKLDTARKLAGAERHSGPEDYDAADSFDRRSSKGADQLEGPRAHYPRHSIPEAARDIYCVDHEGK